MKLFNNLQELWDYALYCPICEDMCRTISLSLNPDRIFKPDPLFSKDELLNINFIATLKNTFNSINLVNGHLKINCLTNQFIIEDLSNLSDKFVPILLKKLDHAQHKAELFLESHCLVCGNSAIYSNDIELDFSSNSLKEIKLNLEIVEIKIDSSKIYTIEQKYDDNQTWIEEYHTLDNGKLRRKASYRHNLLNIDFSDLKKAFNRIKTILVFS